MLSAIITVDNKEGEEKKKKILSFTFVLIALISLVTVTSCSKESDELYIFNSKGENAVEFENMLADRWRALLALAIVTTWQSAGYMMIIYINGLNNIPKSLIEAAEMDGATKFQQFRYVTAPMLMPSFTICIFLTLANSFKLLDQNIALKDGEMNFRLLAAQILKGKDVGIPNYGLVQAESVIFFVLVATITIAQVIITSRKEVES